MVGYGENLGSGFPLILDAWKQAGWDTPVLNNKFELDMVELVLPLSAISEKVPNSTVEIAPSVENDDGGKSRGKSREKIINIIRNNPTVTQLELSNMLQISTKAIYCSSREHDPADAQRTVRLQRIDCGRKV